MSRIKLNVLGISYSQTQTGAYALVLTEEKGERRIPIIIGGFEAQAIAIQLEGLKPPRPLTHDLFLNFSMSFGINLIEVNIYRLEEGVFYSKLICNNGGKDITIDARTSDAIALALRFKCPMYTTEEILQKSGIVIDIHEKGDKKFSKSKTIESEDEKTFPTADISK
ncbi:MAG: bifunctional nuclease family protein [Bacteroidales bacterium]|jgi:bifunctional DNase/RNase|nr:bifunctional nuclease family protein [Bacteroidales bacterium]